MIPENEIAELTQKVKRLERRLAEERSVAGRLKELVKSLSIRNGYLISLNDVTSGLMDRTDLDQLLETIVTHACTLAKTDHGFMHLLESDRKTLLFKIGTGGFEKAVGIRIGADQGVAGIALSRGEAFWVKDYRSWKGRIDHEEFKDLRSCLVLPLKNGTGTIGLGRFGEDDKPFSMTEVAMLRRFASMASICINNAALYQDLERELRNRKRAEEILRLSEKEFFSLFESVQMGFYRTDSQGRVTMANAAAVEMMGYDSLDEAIGISMVDLYKNPRDRDVLLETIFTEGRVSAYEVEMRRKDNKVITVLVNAHVRHNEVGEFIGIQGTVVDITYRKHQAAESLHSQKLAAIGSLAAGIAHEINTPVQYVSDNAAFLEDAFGDLQAVARAAQSLSQALEGGGDTGEAAAAMAQALETADMEFLEAEIPQAIAQSLDGLAKVKQIVRSMKEFSHSGRDYWEMGDINHILDNTLTVARNEWKYTAEVEKLFQPDLPKVRCNPGELGQVFLNLIINACHSIADRTGGREKGTITIATAETDTGVEIRISDNGTGIPEEVRDQIFDPFFTTKAVGRGSGQGLAIAHSVVAERHQGKLSFETEVGRGTTFVIFLPLNTG